MNVAVNIILAAQILSAIVMVGLILIQHGKGADMGAAFGSGSSGSLFGASGSANFLSRTTAILAGVFFVATLALAYFGAARPTSSGSVLENGAGAAAAPTSPKTLEVPAGQIPAEQPASTAPATKSQPVSDAPASGAGQIPTK